jgi:hypothetical protein
VDRGVLLVVTGVIGAVEREVAQPGELGFDPVQLAGVSRQEHQLHAVGGQCAPGSCDGREVVGS